MDKLQTTEKQGVVYTAEQVLLHNKITSLICGNLERASTLPENERKSLEAETNTMVKRYFDFLLGNITPKPGNREEQGLTGKDAGKAAASGNKVAEALILSGSVYDKHAPPG